MYQWKRRRYKYKRLPPLNAAMVPQKSLLRILIQSHMHLTLPWQLVPAGMSMCLGAMLAGTAGPLADLKGQASSDSGSDVNAQQAQVVPSVAYGTRFP